VLKRFIRTSVWSLVVVFALTKPVSAQQSNKQFDGSARHGCGQRSNRTKELTTITAAYSFKGDFAMNTLPQKRSNQSRIYGRVPANGAQPG
jgi:hypothetical protein